MRVALKCFRRAACLAPLMLVVFLAGSGCRRPSPTGASAEPTPEPTPESTPDSRPVGEHPLTESPPVTVADLDRLLSLGFTVDEVISEIERRGVLKLPDPAEREHIQRLPRGDRLLDTMEKPGNLLTTAAVSRYGHRQAGAPNMEQWHAARAFSARQVALRGPGGEPDLSPQQQQCVEYLRRHAALTDQINALCSQRQTMKRRGQSTVTITMQIERLERERDALVSPL